jgi:GMP synthase-like glutamine amidotransferase
LPSVTLTVAWRDPLPPGASVTLRPVRVLSVVHQRDSPSGVFSRAAAQRGDQLVEWIPAEAVAPELDGFAAVLVFGGGMDVDQEDAHPWLRGEKELLRGLLGTGVPVLGVCLGAQLLAEVAGGSVRRAAEPEIGWKPVELTPEAATDPVLGALPDRFDALQWHHCEFTLPDGGVALARSAVCLQAFRLRLSPTWGIQFHAEVTEETVESWLRDYPRDADAARSEVDRGALLAQTMRDIGRWNELGIGLCRRFLERAEATRP